MPDLLDSQKQRELLKHTVLARYRALGPADKATFNAVEKEVRKALQPGICAKRLDIAADLRTKLNRFMSQEIQKLACDGGVAPQTARIAARGVLRACLDEL